MRRPNLQAERARLGLTTEQVADSLGVTRQTYSRWEHSDCALSFDNVCALMKLFGENDFDYLLKTIDD